MDVMSTRFEEIRLELTRRRLEAIVTGTWLAVASAIASVGIVAATFWHSAMRWPVLGWAGVAILLMLIRLAMLRRVDLASRDYRYVRSRFILVNVMMIAMSLVWAVGLSYFASIARGIEAAALAVIGTAMFVGVLLINRAAPIAAYVHVLLLATGFLIAAWFTIGPDAWMVLAMVLIYGITLLIAIERQNSVFVRSVTNEIERREAAETVRMLLNDYEAQSPDWLWTVGKNGNLRNVSARFAEAAGKAPEALEGMSLTDLFLPGEGRDMLSAHLAEQRAFRDVLVSLTVRGEQFYWRLSARPRDDGRMSGVSRDVTADQLIEERVNFMAHFDNLTGLANRHLFNDRLRAALSVQNPTRRNVVLFYLDLDDFKAINDTRGHPVGDQLLHQVGQRLAQEVRNDDLVARLGGDEFAILIDTRAGDGILIERAHRFLSVVRAPYEIEGQVYRVSTSVGVARCTDGNCDAEELMRRADLALYAAKAKGRDRFTMYETSFDQAARDRRDMETSLRDAVDDGKLRLFYQPVIDLNTGQPSGYEALLRWDHPRRGLITPDDFLSVAEETGLIVPIGEWVIHQALNDIARWPGDFRIAINLSPTQVRSPHLATVVARELHASGVSPARVEFEITEHVLLHDDEACLATLLRLHELGVKIALDDFGTGYSSLSYLRRFPFDRIKIDRNFVQDIAGNHANRAIVSTITRLADALGMTTTAEGVENRLELDLLRKLGCQEAQGFLICRPLPVETIIENCNAAGQTVLFGELEEYRKAREAALRRNGSKVA